MTDLAQALTERPVVLDGGLSTQLEARGHDLSDSLWSARLLLTDPDEVAAAHADFFAAGAEVAITASYQVSRDGFLRAGLTSADADLALRRSVELARRAAEEAGGERWVAASIGPYGATLADGSEYTGDYDLDLAGLRAWHRPRLEALIEAGPDLLACETIPSAVEAEALITELADLGFPAWLSLTVADGRTRRGDDLAEAFALAGGVPNLIAVGANCCRPDEVAAVVEAAGPTGLPVVFYPNSGEAWDAAGRRWTGAATVGGAADAWVAAGVRLLGGCCRVTPAQISALAAAVR